jgi:fructose transport system permease protein
MSTDSKVTTGTRQSMADHEKVLADAKTDVASFDAPQQSTLVKIQRALHANPTIAPVVVLLVSVLIFGMLANNFFTAFNLTLIVQQVTIIGILGIAQTLIILTAGIDLSVAAIMVLSTVAAGTLGVNMGVPTPIALGLGLLCGTVCGMVNGGLVTIFRLPPFIVTLGTWKIFFALNLWLSGGQSIRSTDIDNAAPLLKFFGTTFNVAGAQFTTGSIAMLLLFAIFWFVLNWSAWGRHIYAVGDDANAARLSGINSKRVLLSVYAVAGFLCAFAGWVSIGRVGSVSPQSFFEGNLDAITAVVIGGTSLFGGRGSIIGTLVGALIVGVFRSGLNLSGVDVLWQQFAVGALIITAVAIDQWLRKVSS